MACFKPPNSLKFDENIERNFNQFLESLSYFMKASGYDKKDDETKVSIFLNIAGEEAQVVFRQLGLSEEEKKKYTTVVEAFKQHCAPVRNETYDRFKFFNRFQGESEDFEHFLTDIRTLAQACNFEQLEEGLLKDKIVIGINDRDLQERLLRTPKLTLKTAIEYCRASEVTKRQLKVLTKEEGEGNMVSYIKQGGKKMDGKNKNKKEKEFKCKYCNRNHKPRQCPAYGKTCMVCKKENHFAEVCKFNMKQTNKKNVRDVKESHNAEEESTEEDDKYIRLDSIINNDKNVKQWTQKIDVNGKNIVFKLDTGSECSILPFDLLQNNLKNNLVLEKTNTVLVVYNGNKIKPLGTVNLKCNINEKESKVRFVIIKESRAIPILGLEDCLKLGLIKRVDKINVQVSKDKTQFIKENSSVFEGLGNIGMCKIKLKDDAEPIIKPLRRIPESIKPQLKIALNKLESNKIIEKVEGPTEWCHNLVVVQKPDGSLRLCLDPRYLNQYIIREKCQIPSLEEICSRLAGKKFFSVLDMKDGFFQVKLDKQSSKLCSFGTPFGVYRFLRMPFGISSAPEIMQNLMFSIFNNIEGVETYFDDIIISGTTLEKHDRVLQTVIDRAKRFNVKFNKNKVQYRINQVKFLGLILSEKGISCDPDNVNTILKLEPPKNVKGVQKFLGMCNYISKFIPRFAEITAPLRELTKKDNSWNWGENENKAFTILKEKITQSPTLRVFDKEMPITLQTDSSKNGVGACLLQNGQPVSFYSKSLTEAQVRWAPIEKELFAICCGVEKYHQFVYGYKVKVETDHKPLVSIVKKDINKVSARLQRMLLKLLKYKLEVTYVPGSKMYIADFLSRNYLKNTGQEDKSLLDVVHCMSAELPISDSRLLQLQKEGRKDENLKTYIEWYNEGFPKNNKNVEGKELKILYKLRNDITVQNGILYWGKKVIIPKTLRKEMLNIIHTGHLGIDKCKARARSLLYWPGITLDIENLIRQCKVCEKYNLSNPKETFIGHEIPELPFNKVGMDLFQFKNHDYLLVIDYYSKWIEVKELENKTAGNVINRLKQIFSVHGIPEIIISDNMPFSSYNFKKFTDSWGIKVITSSPRYPKSNGLAERGVGVVKRLLKKCLESDQDIYLALLTYRNTPITGMSYSPAQMLFSRTLRDKLPCTKNSLKPQMSNNVYEQLLNNQKKSETCYNKTSVEPKSFNKDDNVLIQNLDNKTWAPGKIVDVYDTPRSYIVQKDTGRHIRRNSVHLRKSYNDVVIRPKLTEIDNIPDSDIYVKNRTKPSLSKVVVNKDCEPIARPSDSSVQTRSGRVIKEPSHLRDFVGYRLGRGDVVR
nr:uncharacterized protein K02A2.6-like [Onthophagus taurus]